jgi:hypothetical protein
MASGESRIEKLGDVGFRGQVGKNVARYARDTQQLARDLAIEFDVGAMAAESAMLKLKKHPRLRGIQVRVRAILVARRLRRARDLAKGIAAESVKFALTYRREFMEIDDSGRHQRDSGTGGVDL